MTANKYKIIDKIELTSDGFVQVRTNIVEIENSKEINNYFDFHTIKPNQDYSNEDVSVRKFCDKIFAAKSE